MAFVAVACVSGSVIEDPALGAADLAPLPLQIEQPDADASRDEIAAVEDVVSGADALPAVAAERDLTGPVDNGRRLLENSAAWQGAAEGGAGEAIAKSTLPYKVRSGDSLATVARKLGLDTEQVAARNKLAVSDKLTPGQVLQVDLDVELAPHVVQPGETAEGIASRSQVDPQFMAAINNLVRPERLFAGQTLLVPRLETGSEQKAKPERDRPAEQKADKVAAPDQREAGVERRDQPPTSRGGREVEQLRERFIAAAAAPAQAAQAATAVPASVTIAQAILESDWGRSAIGNNYFGIKANTKGGPAGVAWSPTKEYTAKGWVTIQAAFRAYHNMEQSFVDHANFFIENTRYAEALRNVGDARTFARLIHKAGYATDPTYSQSLIRLMDTFDLYRFDEPAD